MTLSRKAPMGRSIPMKGAAFSRVEKKEKAASSKAARGMKARKVPANAAEKVWMAAVAELGCIVCRRQGRGFVPCAVHHIVEGNRRVGHLFTIGLCDPGHHQNTPDPEQISRHPNKARFTAAYGSEYDLLKITQDIVNGVMR